MGTIYASSHDERCHMISYLQTKIQHYGWTEEEIKYFWKSNQKEKKVTSFDSKSNTEKEM